MNDALNAERYRKLLALMESDCHDIGVSDLRNVTHWADAEYISPEELSKYLDSLPSPNQRCLTCDGQPPYCNDAVCRERK